VGSRGGSSFEGLQRGFVGIVNVVNTELIWSAKLKKVETRDESGRKRRSLAAEVREVIREFDGGSAARGYEVTWVGVSRCRYCGGGWTLC
jgi:hypothetical protein